MTNTPNRPKECAGLAVDALGRARRLLCSPDVRNVELCTTALKTARQYLETTLAHCDSEQQAERMAAGAFGHKLRSDLHAISALLERAARYHAGLLHAMQLAARTAGAVESAPKRSRLHVEV